MRGFTVDQIGVIISFYLIALAAGYISINWHCKRYSRQKQSCEEYSLSNIYWTAFGISLALANAVANSLDNSEAYLRIVLIVFVINIVGSMFLTHIYTSRKYPQLYKK